jgi:outer membrane protein insertion porin family
MVGDRLKRTFKFFAVLVLLVGLWGPAVSEALAVDVIREIKVEGVRRIEPDAVLSRISHLPGERLDPGRLDQDIRQVYESGFFYDVKVDVVDTSGGQIVTFIVEEKPSVKEFVYEGNDEFDEEKINENVDLKPNSILSISKIKENINKIRQMYENEGYFMVDIDYELEELPNNRVRVIIRITEYKKVYIKRITFLGNRAYGDKRLKKVVLSKEGHAFSFLTSSGIYRKDMFLNDIQMLRAFYLDNGYVNVQIGPPVVSMSADKKWMFVSVSIDEGQQYYVDKVLLDGELLFDEDDLRELVDLKTGDPFSRQKLEKSVEALRNKYTDIGYAFAQVNTSTPTDKEKRTIDVKFTIDRGKLAYFEEINISGNDRTRDKVIRRELYITEGDLYSGPGIRRSKERLMRLGYFDEVKITTDKGSNDESVILTISVVERMQGSFVVGVGFSSLENFVGTAQVSHNNLYGYGTRLSLQAEVGRYRTNVTTSVRQPYLLDTKWIGSLNLVYSERDFFTFDRFDKSASAGLGRPLYWDIEAHVGYTFRDVEIKNVANQAALFLTLQEGRTITTSNYFTMLRNTVNHPFDPTAGTKVSGTVEYATESTGGDLNFIKYTAVARHYFPIYWGVALMVNGEAGYAENLDDGRLHISERYFLGGLNSVRGFFQRSLGPREESIIATNSADPDTTLTEVESVIGGNKYAQGNIELLIPIVKELQIKGVIFYDAGNAFLEEESIDLYELRQSWGFGIRWISPMGPLRFEWGYPLYQREDEEKQVFEFGIGTFF